MRYVEFDLRCLRTELMSEVEREALGQRGRLNSSAPVFAFSFFAWFCKSGHNKNVIHITDAWAQLTSATGLHLSFLLLTCRHPLENINYSLIKKTQGQNKDFFFLIAINWFFFLNKSVYLFFWLFTAIIVIMTIRDNSDICHKSQTWLVLKTIMNHSNR